MRRKCSRFVLPAAGALPLFLLCSTAALHGQRITVSDTAQLKEAVRRLRAGMTVLLAPGDYSGGIWIQDAPGAADLPIVLRGEIPDDPPRILGGKEAVHVSNASYLHLANLIVSGSTANGISIDDGGSFDTPSHHIVVESIAISDIGPRGNRDALKLSGVRDFVVNGCSFDGWGGSAVDMVGCHGGVIEDCRFTGRNGFSQSNGVQAKGGSSGILIRRCFFRDSGQRSINMGGSTGLEYFRPRASRFEASKITVAGCRFVGSLAPLAWVGCTEGRFRHNTVYMPGKWVARILQENTAEGFLSCRNGIFEGNLIVTDARVRVFVNVGPDTSPDTFTFRRNAWYQSDGTGTPVLPVPEEDGVYQVDPLLRDAGTDRMRIGEPRLAGFGADAYEAEND